MRFNKRINNFDLLRLLFSIIVALVHTAQLSGIKGLAIINTVFSSEIAVDAFFVISGFLIFMSFDSTSSVRSYVGKRIRRILPGYSAVIILCAFLLYFTSTKLLLEYFNIDFLKYIFFNLLTLNFIQPTLPGVLENNSVQAVNGALWTIKIEVMFYILVPFIVFLFSRFNKLWVLLIIYTLSVSYSIVMLWLSSYYHNGIFTILERQIPGQLAFFISGAMIYYFYDFFHKHSLFVFIVSLSLLLIHKYAFQLYIIYPASLALVVIYFASVFKYMGNFGKFGDLSFGIYIWHFPILQLFISYELFLNSILGLILLISSISFAAYMSWHLIEKQFLYKSSHYVASEKEA